MRRGAFITVIVALVALIIATLLFVGDDTSSSHVSTGSSAPSTPRTAGFAAGLPAAVTATSFSNPEAIPSTSSTSSSDSSSGGQEAVGTATSAVGGDTGSTVGGGSTTSPSTPSSSSSSSSASNTTTTTTATTTTTTSTTTTTTTAPPPFSYTAGSHQAHGTYNNISAAPGCQPPSAEDFVFSTPSPGVIAITRIATSVTATGSVDPSGNFNASNGSDVYAGTTTQTSATGTFSTGKPCQMSADVSWTFA